MSGEPSTFVMINDCLKAIMDAIEIFIREMCIKFIALWIELINYQQQKKEMDLQRIVSLVAILYITSFLDFDFIPIVGKIDDIIVMFYSFHYCCNKKQAIIARNIYKDYENWCKLVAIIWLLY